jgi:small subunit ribosomal protein S17
MAEEEKQQNEEQTEDVEAQAADEPAGEEAPPEAADAPDAEQGEADPAAPGGEAEEAAGSDSPEEDQEPDAGAPAEAAESVLSPKALRKLERSRFTGEARPQRSPDERVAERAERRRAKATSRRSRRPRERERRRGGDGTPAAERRPGSRKVRQGTVVSDKADKTITVRIEVVRRHPVYEKVVRRSATVHAHDEGNEASEGDTVRVIESRPLSRTKRWRLLEVLERAR